MITPAFDYGNPITQGGGGGGGTAEAWTRPDDWLAMPTVTAAEQKIVGLHAVWPSDANFVALTCSGNYQVDWGDGNTTTHSSGATAYHEYDYSTISADTESTRGYRQVLVTITPQAGANLTSVNLRVKHNQAGLINSYSSGWLDLIMSIPNATSFTFGDATSVITSSVTHRLVERVNIVDRGSITYNAIFGNCHSLQKVELPDSAGVTNTAAMFRFCSSLRTVDLFDTSSVTTTQWMFADCLSLTEVPLFDLSACTQSHLMFQNCRSLETIPQFNTANVQNMSDMFNGCYSLGQLPVLNTASVSNFNSMFYNCNSLSVLPAWNMSGTLASGGLTSLFQYNYSMKSILATGFKHTFSVANLMLSANALDTIYTNLATVVGQTITVSGNYGTTGDDPTIATAKGWTVTG